MLSCPFCKNKDLFLQSKGCTKYYVKCLNKDCKAHGPIMNSKEEAIDAWNDTFKRDIIEREDVNERE